MPIKYSRMVLKRTNNSSNTNKYHSMTGLTKLIRTRDTVDAGTGPVSTEVVDNNVEFQGVTIVI